MEKYPITLQLLGRDIPVNVTPAEETRIRLVVQLIEDKLHRYRSLYKITDEVYLALMACMDITSDYLKATEQQEQAENELTEQLRTLNATLAAELP